MVITSQKVEKLDHSSLKLSISVAPESVDSVYKDILVKYTQNAQLPGFRKGKVPSEVILRKFGEAIKAESLQKLLDGAFQEAMKGLEDSQKPLAYAQARLDNEDIDLVQGKSLDFALVYDIFPEIKLGEYKGLEVTEAVFSPSKDDEEQELKRLQEQNAIVAEKKGKAAKGDYVTVDTVELDDQEQEIEESRRQGSTMTLGDGANRYLLDEELLGTQKGDEKILTRAFPSDYQFEDLAGRSIKIKVLVQTIKEKKLPELDNDFAQDISEDYKTLDDLKKALKEKMQGQAENILRERKLESLLTSIAENTKVDLPASMIRMELENSWSRFASQNRMSEEQLEKMFGRDKKEQLLETWRPSAEKSLTHRLILNKITEAEAIDATDEELTEEIQRQADASGMSLDEAKDYLAKNSLMDYVRSDIKDKKTVDFLLGAAKVKKGKKVSFLDLSSQKE